MRVHILDVPFEMRAVASACGASWNADAKAHVYKGDTLPEGLIQFASQDYSWERWREDDLNKTVKAVTLSKTKFTPRPHQMEAGRRIDQFVRQGCRGFLEADDVGLGKSISCLLGAYSVAKHAGFTKERPARVLIVCPASAIPHWRQTLRSVTFSSHFRAVVINYERLSKLLVAPKSATDAKRTRTKNLRTAKQGTPVVKWDVIIADESHKLKNFQESQRAKAFSRVAEYAERDKHAPFVIWASATAGQNPLEVGYLAPLVGQVTRTAGLNLSTWGPWLERKGFGVKKGKVAWSWVRVRPGHADESQQIAQQKADIQKMRDILFDPAFPSIRRLPEDIAGWPSIQRIAIPVALSREQRALYQEVWTTFRNFLRLNGWSKDPQGALAQQLRFRQKSSLLRAQGTADLAHDLLDNDHQVAISVAFLESAEALRGLLEAKGHTCAMFTGANNVDRHSERLRFQRGDANVIIYTVTEAVSFHAGESLPDGSRASMTPRATIVHDTRYSAIENVQIDGRAHRDGQSANSYYVYGQDTVEEKIIKVMFGRMANMRHMVGDDASVVAEIEALLSRTAGAPIA